MWHRAACWDEAFVTVKRCEEGLSVYHDTLRFLFVLCNVGLEGYVRDVLMHGSSFASDAQDTVG